MLPCEIGVFGAKAVSLSKMSWNRPVRVEMPVCVRPPPFGKYRVQSHEVTDDTDDMG